MRVLEKRNREKLVTILKVQLENETGRRKGLPRGQTFVECAHEMIDSSEREKVNRVEIEETGWSRIMYRRPRIINMDGSWFNGRQYGKGKSRHTTLDRGRDLLVWNNVQGVRPTK